MSSNSFNPFTRRRLLQGSAAVAASSLLPATKAFAFTGPLPANTAPTYPGQVTPIPAVTCTLQSTEISGASLSQGYAGLSLEKSALSTGYFGTATVANADLVNLYNVLAPNGSVLRLGGGSTDAYKWATSGTEIITQADLNILKTFLAALPKWKVLYAVNMGGFGPNAASAHVTTIAQTSNEVAALYATIPNSQIMGIEIGNEPDGYVRGTGPWSPLTVTAYSVTGTTGTFTCANKINLTSPSNLPDSKLTLAGFSNSSVNGQVVTVTSATATTFVATFGTAPTGSYTGGGTAAPNWGCVSPNTQYLSVWQAFYNAITTQTSSAVITGAAGELWGNDLMNWTGNFADYVKANSLAVSPITQHFYDTNSTNYSGKSPAYTGLLYNPYPNLLAYPNNGSSNFWQLSTAASGSNHAGLVPTTTANGQTWRISECNSCADGGYPLVSDAYASSLWAIDFALQMAMLGNTGCNFHGDQKYAFTTTGSPQSGGNYYSPINDDGTGVITNVQPLFYGLTFVNQIGIGPLMTTPVISGISGLNINAYAVYKAANGGSNLYGGVDLIIVNKDPTHTLNLTIDAYGTHNIGSATLYQLTQGPSGFSTLPNPAASDEGGAGQCEVTWGGTAISTSGGGTITPVTLNCSTNQTACYVPLLGAVLIKILFSN